MTRISYVENFLSTDSNNYFWSSVFKSVV